MYSLVVILTLAGALPDRGIFPERLARVNLAPPRAVDATRGWLRVDRAHRLATLYDGDDPIALFALDAADLPSNVRKVEGAPLRREDRDGDGIVDRLDVLVGATDAEMDLLSWVPVTHHFRWAAPSGGRSHAR